MELSVKFIKSKGWVLEDSQEGQHVFLLHDMIFAQKKEDQIDIFYELKFNKKKQFMSILKYFNGAESRTMYTGNASEESLIKEMESFNI